MAAQLPARSRFSPRIWGPSSAAQNRTPAGEKQFPKKGPKCYGAFPPSFRVQRKSGKKAASLSRGGGGLGGGEKHGPPPQKKSRCGERGSRRYASGQNLDGGPLFDVFEISGTRTPFDLITGTRIGSFLGPSAARMAPFASCKESTNPWPTGERRRLERGASKAVELGGAGPGTATRSSWGVADTPIMTPGLSPLLLETRTRISDRTAVHLFTASTAPDHSRSPAPGGPKPEERGGEEAKGKIKGGRR
ncbi:hypothetical protein GWK47_021568 [Chionoecetes opilio]|uniref:Uncharacterized protein n=1 Tax=Chionoecetes opilio TaxID=41210 RepID=A0A8J5CEB8_CHIOP|nr:hypothetical protein GWK47_021568 [Chionoecetes opilio]